MAKHSSMAARWSHSFSFFFQYEGFLRRIVSTILVLSMLVGSAPASPVGIQPAPQQVSAWMLDAIKTPGSTIQEAARPLAETPRPREFSRVPAEPRLAPAVKPAHAPVIAVEGKPLTAGSSPLGLTQLLGEPF